MLDDLDLGNRPVTSMLASSFLWTSQPARRWELGYGFSLVFLSLVERSNGNWSCPFSISFYSTKKIRRDESQRMWLLRVKWAPCRNVCWNARICICLGGAVAFPKFGFRYQNAKNEQPLCVQLPHALFSEWTVFTSQHRGLVNNFPNKVKDFCSRATLPLPQKKKNKVQVTPLSFTLPRKREPFGDKVKGTPVDNR